MKLAIEQSSQAVVETVSPEDDTLAQAAVDSPQAFGELYRRYAVGVYRYLYGRTGNQADAEDLTAQVFIEALESLPRYRPRGQFAAWLYTIVRRRAVDRLRRQRPQFSLEWLDGHQTAADTPLGQVIHREDLQRLADLCSQLDKKKQELVHLRFAAGLSYAQIAQINGKSEAAVGMALHRLMKWFQDHWEDENE
ncbi:MAG: sigma-70 family RNA polymerase sigma factor [Anaerolineae bacterium]|nr:sigma-70 family RNA polymerase sigma factor [Anaerolineae bacterium]